MGSSHVGDHMHTSQVLRWDLYIFLTGDILFLCHRRINFPPTIVPIAKNHSKELPKQVASLQSRTV